jgi:hypothetical protein
MSVGVLTAAASQIPEMGLAAESRMWNTSMN